MAWRRPGDKPLSEPMMVRLPTHICVTRPQWVKYPWWNNSTSHQYPFIHELVSKWMALQRRRYLRFVVIYFYFYGSGKRSICLVHPAVRDKRRVSEIDLSQPRHETAFWWRHNGPVTSQLTDPIKWRNYPFELMFKCAYINTHNKESMTQRYRISINVQLYLIFLYISIWFES